MNKNVFSFGSYKYNKQKAPYLQSRLFIGDFSVDGQRKFHSDKRNLKFIDEDTLNRKIDFDLNKCMHKTKKKDVQAIKQEKLERLLEWILQNKFKFITEESKESGFASLCTDFISSRGLLADLLCTPYDSMEGWIIHATKFAGTIYLLAVETPEGERRRLYETEQSKIMSSWGFKFEQFMTNEDTNEGVDENEEYCCVLKTRLAQHSLVYRAEVDCADKRLYRSPHSSLSAFVELKTCKELGSDRDLGIFHRFRLRKWWAQSHLVGIPRVMCGFRDEKGVVHSVQSYKVEEMPNMAQIYWSKDVMFNFLDNFLSWVKTVVIKDDSNFVYKFSSFPREGRITCVPLGSSSANFLPQFYTKEIF